MSGAPYHQWGPPSLDAAATPSLRHCIQSAYRTNQHRIDLRESEGNAAGHIYKVTQKKTEHATSAYFRKIFA